MPTPFFVLIGMTFFVAAFFFFIAQGAGERRVAYMWIFWGTTLASVLAAFVYGSYLDSEAVSAGNASDIPGSGIAVFVALLIAPPIALFLVYLEARRRGRNEKPKDRL